MSILTFIIPDIDLDECICILGPLEQEGHTHCDPYTDQDFQTRVFLSLETARNISLLFFS